MKKITTGIIAISCLVVLTGCATQPSNIGASYVPLRAYENHNCDQLVSESVHVNRRLIELYASLKNKANADAAQMGIGLVLFWPTLFFLEGGDGPEATEYSRLRGEHEAIRKTAIEKKCPLDDIPGIKTPEDFEKESDQEN